MDILQWDIDGETYDNHDVDIYAIRTATNANKLLKVNSSGNGIDIINQASLPISTDTQTALNAKADTTALTAHTTSTSNPHSVTKSQVGLGNVDNTADTDKPISTATQTALDAKQATLVSGTNIKTINSTSLLGSGDVSIASGFTGSVVWCAYTASTIPSGYLLCNGAAVSRTTYSALFAVIGTTYGSGDGSTTFNLPNLADKFIEGSTTAGTSKSAGLPNISGSFYGRRLYDVASTGTGCIGYSTGVFTYTRVDTGQGTWATVTKNSNSNYPDRIDFDASTYNSIYGNSDTVQPPAITMLPLIKY